MFVNKNHPNLKVFELRAYQDEEESVAKSRLEKQGWIFPSEAVFEPERKVFVSKNPHETSTEAEKTPSIVEEEGGE